MFKLLWSLNGRIARLGYAGGLLLNLVVFMFLMAVWQVVNDSWARPVPDNLRDGSLLLALVPFAVLFCWALLALAAKRLHDLGITGWFSLLMIVPGANLIMIIVLLMARGEDNDNCYGPRAPATGAPAPA
jgi:uncharacterized membrane protein YhaH (DUF805 family)